MMNTGKMMNTENFGSTRTPDPGGEYLTCWQCGQEFLFSSREQKKYLQRGFDPPRRCPDCRKHRSRLSSEQEWSPRQRKSRGDDFFDE